MKTKVNHTPGPWIDEAGSQRKAGQQDRVDRFVIGTTKNERGGRRVVAVIEGPFCGEREQHEADARLIAAAPDLLAAAKLAAVQVEFCLTLLGQMKNVPDEVKAPVADALGALGSAIAKAEAR